MVVDCYALKAKSRQVVGAAQVHRNGNDQKVLDTILRDTGAEDAFIQASLLPFSNDSDTGKSAHVLGMGSNV